MSSLFITGATGFVGRHLIQSIDPGKKYEKIYCLHRSRVENETGEDRFEFVQGDLTEPESYAARLADCETVIHLAAVTGKAPPDQYFIVNSKGTGLLLDACRKSNVQNFLYASTIAVKYTDKRYYYYAQSKELAEETVRKSGLNFAIVRPTIVLAKDAALWNKLSGLVRKRVVIVPGAGKTRIQPIHVTDLVRCIQTILTDDLFRDEVFEAGGPDPIAFESFLLALHSYRHPERPLLLRLPIKPFLSFLGFLEKRMNSEFPVSAGQFSVFYNDGTIAPNRLMDQCRPTMMSLSRMLEELTSDSNR